MLDRLDANVSPFLDLGRCLGVVPIRHGALGQNRHDPVRAEFGGFLDDEIHCLALGHGLVKRDLERQGRHAVFLDNLQCCRVVANFRRLAEQFLPRAVQDDNAIALAQAQHGAGVFGFRSGEAQRGVVAFLGRNKKSVHAN